MHPMVQTRTIVLIVLFCSMFNFLFGQTADWPNLSKYREANAALAEEINEGRRVVFMGNSITEAWPLRSPAFFTNPSFICRGISGQTSPQMLLRFRSDVIDLNPAVVVILAGTNDIAENTGPITIQGIMDNIKSMTELADQHGIKVILCSVLPAIDFPWRVGLDPAKKIMELNALIKTYARTQNIPYVDYYTAMVDEQGGLKVPEYTTAKDLVHPNAHGYSQMEALLRPQLAAIME